MSAYACNHKERHQPVSTFSTYHLTILQDPRPLPCPPCPCPRVLPCPRPLVDIPEYELSPLCAPEPSGVMLPLVRDLVSMLDLSRAISPLCTPTFLAGLGGVGESNNRGRSLKTDDWWLATFPGRLVVPVRND